MTAYFRYVPQSCVSLLIAADKPCICRFVTHFQGRFQNPEFLKSGFGDYSGTTYTSACASISDFTFH